MPAPVVESIPAASPFAAPAPVVDAAAEPLAPPSAEPPWEEAATSPTAARPPLFDSEPSEPDHLDDDAFFASLREAVTDETPLGPRDPAAGSASYDQDDRGGGLFRRRGR